MDRANAPYFSKYQVLIQTKNSFSVRLTFFFFSRSVSLDPRYSVYFTELLSNRFFEYTASLKAVIGLACLS